MKKVIVVSKTHLDLGFTDYAMVIRDKYLNQFIPNAIDVANSVNNGDDKKFVWTTGSWILNEMLEYGNREKLEEALKNGDIAPHALPFTLHTELLDYDTLDYGLSIVKKLDTIRGKKTIASKMTDVPGHTKALVPLLAKHGIKLLHIGVNGASALADIPPCFLWKNGDSEVVVIYSGEYGGEYKNEYIDDILYFDHTLDNHGASGSDAVLNNVKEIGEKYPGYTVVGGTLDDYAEQIWEIRDRLPVITSEIGDSWIHGAATDPYKAGALRTLIACKNEWLSDGTMSRDSEEYKSLCSFILCLAEHTCGMDCKLIEGINDYYLRKDFAPVQSAGKFQKIEKSWAEQRNYINLALDCLTPEHKEIAQNRINALTPQSPITMDGDSISANEEIAIGGVTLTLNEYGAIKSLGKIDNNTNPLIMYRSYGGQDYENWHKNYNRNIEETRHWSLQDFGRPNLLQYDSQFKQNDFCYKMTDATVCGNKILVNLAIDDYCYEELGAPKLMQAVYTISNGKIEIEAYWFDKPISRITESIALNIPAVTDTLQYQKLGSLVNPLDIVYNGNRKLSAVQKVVTDNAEITNHLNPLVTIGKPHLMNWNNEYGDIKDGISFVLYDNVWGTNFPLWYGDNAYFKFTIEETV